MTETKKKPKKWVNYFLVIIFIVISNLIILEFGFFENIYTPIFARYSLSESFGEYMIGYVLFGSYIMIGGFGLLFGYLTDKYNRIWLMAMALGMWVVFSFLIFISPHWIPFMIFRILINAGHGALMPIGYSLLMDVIKFKNRSKAFALIMVLQFIGPLFGIVMALVIGASWQVLYFYFGIIGIIIGMGFLFFREPNRGATEEQFSEMIEKGARYSYRIKREDLKQIYKRPTNFWLIINFVDTIVPGLLVGWVFYYLQKLNFTDFFVVFSIIFSLLMLVIGYILGTVYLAHLGDKKVGSDKTIRAKIATYCSIITVPFISLAFIFPLFTIPFGILIGIGLFFEQGIGSNWFATIMDINAPENRGTMIALALLADTVGRGVGGLIGGILQPFPQFVWFLVILIVSLINVGLWIPVLKTIRGDTDKIRIQFEERAKEMAKPQSSA